MGDAKLTSPIAFIHIFLRKIYDNNYFTLKAFIPRYTAEAPSSSSILKSWLYLATRSDLDGAPVLIWRYLKQLQDLQSLYLPSHRICAMR